MYIPSTVVAESDIIQISIKVKDVGLIFKMTNYLIQRTKNVTCINHVPFSGCKNKSSIFHSKTLKILAWVFTPISPLQRSHSHTGYLFSSLYIQHWKTSSPYKIFISLSFFSYPCTKKQIHFKRINSFQVRPYLDLGLNFLKRLIEQKPLFSPLKNHKMITE